MIEWLNFGVRREIKKGSLPRDTGRLIAVERLEPRTLLSVGGGFTNAGLSGQYFPNTTLSGSPAFTRQDVRIDFNWGTDPDVAGTTSSGFASVGPNDFSVRWAGQVVPNTSDTYAFTTTSSGGVRLLLRPTGSTTWTTVIDDWIAHSTTVDVGNYTMTADQSYDVELDYYAPGGGAAQIQLGWSSPSTPQEVIDPLSVSGLNVVTYANSMYADAMKSGRVEWGQPVAYSSDNLVAADANDWPLADATKIVWEGRDPATMTGTYLLRFQGKAAVSTSFNLGQFSAGGVTYGSVLPDGAGYDPATNATTATMQISDVPDASILYLTFTDTHRTAASPTNSGLTDISLMRPTSPGASTYFAPGTLFDPNAEAAFSQFTTERWITANFNTTEVNWSDRVEPSYAIANFGANKEVWEYEVMLANETGKDLYITVPVNATDDYVTKLAELIKYGSDGVNPYTSAQANPVYPPLNPNLKIYVEWSNEIWNFAFSQASAAVDNARQAVQNNTPDGQIINFDGGAPDGDYVRWEALRTVQAGNDFREVFGDAAMGSQVRFLLEFQYNNYSNTGTGALSFINNYFDNGDGLNHVANPEPVNYYIWGAGTAGYYISNDPTGAQSTFGFTNSGFEAGGSPLPPGTAIVDPAGTSWTFTGNAGIYSDEPRTSASAGLTLGSLLQSTGGHMAFGYEFTVGSQPIAVYDLGRYVAAGNAQSHEVWLLQADTKSVVAAASVDTSGVAPGQYAYATLAVPVVLNANTTYVLVSSESDGQDAFYGQGTQISPPSGITIDGSVSVSADPAQPANTAAWTFNVGQSGGNAYGPVDFRFASSPVGDLGFVPDAPEGTQAAFIGDTGSISQTISLPNTGIYALQITAANKYGMANALRVFVDGVEVTPNGNSDQATDIPWTPGSGTFGLNDSAYNTLGTAPFSVTVGGGKHTVTFVGTGAPGTYTFIDSVQVTSLDVIFGSGIPVGVVPGTVGQSQTTNYVAELVNADQVALSYDLHLVAYEGGWALGGDRGGTPLENYAKYLDPRAEAADLTALNDFGRLNGALFCFGTYDLWPVSDNAHAGSYPLLEAVVAANQVPARVPVVKETGDLSELGLNDRADSWRLGLSGGVGSLSNGGWVTWNVVVTQPGSYTFNLDTSHGGGTRLVLDGTTILGTAYGGAISKTATLTAGTHTVQLKLVSGTVTFNGLSIVPVASAPPAGTASTTTASSPLGSGSGTTSPGLQTTVGSTVPHGPATTPAASKVVAAVPTPTLESATRQRKTEVRLVRHGHDSHHPVDRHHGGTQGSARQHSKRKHPRIVKFERGSSQ
jgi:hypothetical protein